jgi:hypothetical protein
MTPQEAGALLSPTHREALRAAYFILEQPDFTARLSEAAGRPVSEVLRFAPKTFEARILRTADRALRQAASVAVRSLDPAGGRANASLALAGASGAISGFFGGGALAVELPVTTTLILRAVAEVARRHGEDLSNLETRMECVAVLGLSGGSRGEGPDVGYFAARAAIARLVANASGALVERGAASASATAFSALVRAVAPRFGSVVSERAAASALPILGALGGATLNLLFVRHFERAAHGHFTIRRLERLYGPDVVQAYYRGLRLTPARRRAVRR